MLTSIRLVNYRCFADATLRLGPLTALVGPNASGKTALLHALTGQIGGNLSSMRHKSPQKKGEVWMGMDGEKPNRKEFTYKTRAQFPPQGTRKYLHLDIERLRSANQVREAAGLASNGEDLTNVVATLPRRTQDQLARQLCELVPVLQDVTPKPSNSGNHRLVFQDRWNGEVWYEPNEVSDGTILTLALLTLRYQEEPVELVAIEEPERALHPYLLGEIVQLFRRLASGEPDARPIQVVLATQSAELLEFLQPEEVRFLTRNPEDGSVNVEEAPTHTDDWRQAYDAHQQSLGSLWLSGGLGGVPGG